MEWYEEFDFDENPFMDNEDTELIGYEDLLDEINYRIASNNVLFIEGKEGRGKTALLRKTIDKFKGSGKLVYLNGKKLDGSFNIEDVLKKKQGLFSGKRPKNMILLMDEVQSLSKKNNERLKYYYDQNYIKSIIFTSDSLKSVNFTPSMVERVSKVVKLNDLSEDEAVEAVQRRLNYKELINEDLIKKIWKHSKKNVKDFMRLCEQACKNAVENKRKEVTEEDINAVLNIKKGDEAIKIKVSEDFKPKKENDIAEKYY